jgi:hypothetical protein
VRTQVGSINETKVTNKNKQLEYKEKEQKQRFGGDQQGLTPTSKFRSRVQVLYITELNSYQEE